jgi:beta-lactam-binding protein with PASTA domain
VKCVVPRVVGLKLVRAKRRIVSRHCRVGRVIRKASVLKKKGRVLAQAPRPGKHLKRGSRVNMIVGRGPERK